jgi:hypothetical protein
MFGGLLLIGKNLKMLSNPTTPTKITNQYADWFESRINGFAEKHRSRFQSREMFKGLNGFFLTVSFNQNRRHLRLESPAKAEESQATELDRLTDIYNRACRMVIGRNYHRSAYKDQLPLVVACMDVNGTRYWRSMGEIENGHIHSIWLGTNENSNDLRELFEDSGWLSAIKDRHGIRAIDVQPLRAEAEGTKRLVGYTAKLIGHNHRELQITDDFRILPA